MPLTSGSALLPLLWIMPLAKALEAPVAQTLTFTALDRWVARLMLVASVLPYLALSMGRSTNLPVSSILAAWLIVRGARDWRILRMSVLLALIPVAADFLRMFFVAEQWSQSGILTWIIASAPVGGAAVAALVLREKIIPWLSVPLLASSVIALIQKFVYLDHGQVPWLWAYGAPGYASVSDLAETIATYIQRPFGLFPEPSFMAGSLSLVAFALLVALHVFRRRPGPVEIAALASSAFVIAISGSGTAVVAVALLAAAVVLPLIKRYALIAVLALPAAFFAALYAVNDVLAQRGGTTNYSWADRLASIQGAGKLLVSDAEYFLLGIGRGNSSPFFLTGKVPVDDVVHYNVLPDIYSVLGRIVLENGVILGGFILVPLCLWILTVAGKRRADLGVESLIVWLVAGGLAISYDTAFWLFGFPGLLWGLRAAAQHLPSKEPHADSTYRQ